MCHAPPLCLCPLCVLVYVHSLTHSLTRRLNDPHGMFQLKDTVHLFFQYNPRDLAWGKWWLTHVLLGAVSAACRSSACVVAMNTGTAWPVQCML